MYRHFFFLHPHATGEAHATPGRGAMFLRHAAACLLVALAWVGSAPPPSPEERLRVVLRAAPALAAPTGGVALLRRALGGAGCVDPLVGEQGYLEAANIKAAWGDATGVNTSIVVVDDGVCDNHEDLAVTLAVEGDTSVNCTAEAWYGGHGTSVAGVAAARFNGYGICGTAFNATLHSVPLLKRFDNGDNAAFYFETSMLKVALDQARTEMARVLVCSWGPIDFSLHTLPSDLEASLDAFSAHGRLGRGGLVVFAAGNGGPFDNVNNDGFVSHAATLAVSAVDDAGTRVGFSEWGACVDLVAPGKDIYTTVRGRHAPSDGHAEHSGTSFAAPIVAGVVALMLSVAPALTAEDVQEVLTRTAIHNDPTDPSWVTNAAGRRYSGWYGFGLVDAEAAVQLAARWPPAESRLPPPVCQRAESGDATPFVGPRDVVVGVAAAVPRIFTVSVWVGASHEWRFAVRLALTSPSGTRVVVAREADRAAVGIAIGSAGAKLDVGVNVSLQPRWYRVHAFRDEAHEAHGIWTLTLDQTNHTSKLSVTDVELCIQGAPPLAYHAPPPAPPPAYRAADGATGDARTGGATLVSFALLVTALSALAAAHARRRLRARA